MVIHYEEALYQVYGPLPLPVKKSRKLRHKGSLTCKQPVSTSASISGIQAVNCNTLYEPLSIYAASKKLQTHSCGLDTWSTARSHSDRRNHHCYHNYCHVPWCHGVLVASFCGVFVRRFQTGCPTMSDDPSSCSTRFSKRSWDQTSRKAC